MSRTVPAAVQTALNKDLTFLARLWKVNRKDGTPFYFTDQDQDLVVSGITYKAAHGFQASSILSAVNTAANGLNLKFLLDTAGLTQEDIRHQRFQGQPCEIRVVDWSAPANGTVLLYTGVCGKFETTNEDEGKLDVYSRMRNQRQIGVETFSPGCRAALGDARCTKDLVPLKVNFTVTTIDPSNQKFTAVALNQADGNWNLGVVTWLTGANVNDPMEVAASDQSETSVTLMLPQPFSIQVGDTGTVYPGCDKQWTTCRTRYANGDNFRGEPFDVSIRGQ